MIATVEAATRFEFGVQPDVGKPQQRRRIQCNRPLGRAVPVAVLSSFALTGDMLFKAQGPDLESLSHIFDILHLQAARNLKGRNASKRCLLEHKDVLDERMDENIVTQRRQRGRGPLGGAIQKPRKSVLQQNFGGLVALPHFLPLPRSLCLP